MNKLIILLVTVAITSTLAADVDYSKCSTIICKPGVACLIDSSGKPYCVDSPPAQSLGMVSSAGITGSSGSCTLACPTGHNGSQSSSQSSSVSQCNLACPTGSKCIILNGVQSCITHTGGASSSPSSSQSSGFEYSCEKVSCQSGQWCQLVNGLPKCISQASSASQSSGVSQCNLVCPGGHHCVFVNGVQSCIATSSSGGSIGLGACKGFPCPNGQHCITNNNKPTCIFTSSGSTNLCAGIPCPSGLQCQVVAGRPACLPPAPSACHGVTCPVGLECQVEAGRPVCLQPSNEACRGIQCPADLECKVQGGRPVCLASTNPCKGIHCPGGLTCQPKEGNPVCVLGTDCETLTTRSRCDAESGCGWTPLISCCGNITQVCLPKRNCAQVESCAQKDGEIYHFSDSCRPKSFQDYIAPPQGARCEDLKCTEKGMACLYTKSAKCAGNPCCPVIPVCVIAHTTAGSTIASTGSTVASTGSTTASTTASTFASTFASTVASTFGLVSTSQQFNGCSNIRCGKGEVCCNPVPSLPPKCISMCSLITCQPGFKCNTDSGAPVCM
eukprot:gene4018-4654_t